MKGGDMSVVSQFDVQSLLLEYIKQNNLRDPRRKSQIICDPRLENLFGKARVGHFEMLKLLESHFLIKEPTQVVMDDNEGGLLDPDFGPSDAEGYNDGAMKLSYDKRRKSRKKVEEKEPQSNLDDYAAIDVHNINLIYLRRNLMEDLLDDVDKFNENVVGCFVRIRISGTGQKQDLYRLVQVVGTSKATEKYKTGRKATDYTLEILNLDKTEVVTIDTISNQEFTEEECRRLRQSVKCGLINRLTVGDVQEKARSLQPVRVNDWLESEKLRLGHLRDRASETGRRKEYPSFRECVEKLQLLSNPEERRRRLNEVPQIHADPNMDPDYETAEEGDTDDQYPGTFSRARELSSLRKGRDVQARVPASSNWAAARKSLNTGLASSKNTKAEGARDTWETARGQSAALDPVVWSNNQLSKETVQSCSATPESTTCSPPETSETKKIWYYKDPAGKIQGPFCIIQLRKWSSSGYFPEAMRIWQDSEKQEDSILLTDALNGKFEKDLPPWEPPQSHCAQPSVLVSGTDDRANEQEGWRGNNNTILLDRHQNRHILAGNVNTTLPNASWSAHRLEVVNPVDARSVASPGGWESSRDPLNRGWSGPPQAHNSTRLIAPFSDISHEPVSYQSNGDHGGNTGRWIHGQDIGTNPVPVGQHSNWSSLGQSSSRNHWGNEIYNPPTATLQQSSNMDWPSAQGSLKSPPSPTPVPPMGAGWGALYQSPGANLEQNKTAPVGIFSGSLGLSSLSKPPNFTGMLGTNVQFPQKLDGLVDSRALNQRADAAVLGVYTRTEFSEGVSSNQFFESECPSPTPRIERPETTSLHDELDLQKKWPDANKGLGSAPSCVGPASATSHLPTALQPKADNSESVTSNAAEGLQVLSNPNLLSSEPDDNMSPIKEEVKLSYPASGTMLPRESSISELLLNQISDGLAPTSAQRQDINGPSLKPAPSGNRWEQIQTKKQESSVQRPELLKVEGQQDIVKGEEWSLPSPTPSSKPSHWNKGTDFASGHSQNNPWCTYEREQSSQTVTGSEDAPGRSWGLALQNGSMLAGPAQGEPNSGIITAIQGNANVGWATPAEGNTTWNASWATSASQGHVDANKGFEFPEENSNATAGWGMAAQVNANPNTDWGTPSQAKSTLNTGWGAPSHGHANPNTSLVSMPQGETAPVWGDTNESVKTNSGWPVAVGWGTGLQDTSAGWGTKQYQQEDRYRVGLDNDLKPDSRHGGNSRRGGDLWYDSRYDGWRSQQDGRVHSDRGGGSSRLSPKGGVQGRGQTGICKFHESGYCKKGASCKYRHL
ncbi:zinc finger CCCH domain-containing protein 19-like [Iris pallida]|uniref:Zinc finger CCCH domain-containing protein 19-like n=1 Tax=Iris pallida TaxID=29817 RepID=A0AAX6GBK5_IRIPA|nr:zinc finger CCCH domain-containing protein 19-like [Iris pallida]